ncbi:hypothetical protein E4T47_06020 [Aureobasidium subglaciale]|nr:hypothetical protein E4T47_06020 [Aureobasidium subglaciale]
MRRRRASISSSSDQPWWQKSSDSQKAAGSALTASLVGAPSSGTSQRYTTIFLTRTQYTTYIYSHSPSTRSSGTATSQSPSSSHSMSIGSSRLTSASSWSALFTYQPTTFSTTTTARVTTHSTTTVRTIVYITSTRTVQAESSAVTTGATPVAQDTTATTSTIATSSTSEAAGWGGSSDGNGGSRDSLLVSPEGSSNHSAAIAGGMTGSLAGIALIGLLFLFFFRRRKRQIPYQEKDTVSGQPRMSSSSQALPIFLAAHSNRNRNRDKQDTAADRLPVIDHNLIHMDVGHWDRPYVHEDHHLHDNNSPLRLMNPDPTPTPPVVFRSPSNSLSPDTAPNNPHGFLHRQRSALTAAILSIKHSFSSQDVPHRHASDESYVQPSTHPSAHPSPLHIQNKNTNKLTMPSEAILAGISDSRPMSSQSAMSNNTIIRHKAPDDPFVTSASATPNSPLPNCLRPGHVIARRDFLAPPPLRTRTPIQASPTPRHGAVSPISRSNSDCSTRFESWSPTRSEISSVSVRSGPFDLATASVVDGESGRQAPTPSRGQREQTPDWEVHVHPGT